MRLCMAILAAVLLTSAPTVATAACYGTNSKTKKRQSVHEIYRSSSHPKRYFAESAHDPKTGRPLIIYYARYGAAPAYFKSVVRGIRPVIATRSPPIAAPCGGRACRRADWRRSGTISRLET